MEDWGSGGLGSRHLRREEQQEHDDGRPGEGRTRRRPSGRGHIMRDRIGESARDRLLLSSYLPLRAVGCSFRDGVLTLRGRVPSYYQKQLAQAIVAEVEGVREIVNEIQVAGAEPRSWSARDEA